MDLRLGLWLLVWFALYGGSAMAQDSPRLIVTLTDISDRPVAGAIVVIRDRTGDRDITQAITDPHGEAAFVLLDEAAIRVAVTGQLPNGVRFFQPGNDAPGMVLFLQPGTNHMNLLADSDGMIAPDPRTMSALESGVPVATTLATAVPTALRSLTPTTSALLAAPQARSLIEVADTAHVPTAPTNHSMIWLGLIVLVLLICAGIGIVVLQRRWR